MKRLRILPLLLILGALVFPAPVAASTPNLAGHPVGGTASTIDPAGDETCHGIAYGKVNSFPVLFVASHCYTDQPSGTIIKGPDGARIGTLGPQDPGNSGIQSRDMRFIYLDNGRWPGSRNRIYRGDVPGNNYWEITAQPSGWFSCSRIGTADNWNGPEYTAYHNFQPNMFDDEPYRQGQTKNFFDPDDGTHTVNEDSTHCSVQTDLTSHGMFLVDSGSPWVIESNRLWGWSQGRTNPGDFLYVIPAYDAIEGLDDYYETVGAQTGAYFCQDPACTVNPGQD